MSAQHTRGPWTRHPYSDREPTQCEQFEAKTIAIGVGEKLVAEVTAFKFREGHVDTGYPCVDDFEENEANARLIAAAPELLKALQFFVDHPGVWQLCSADSRAMTGALAAIAKATGSAS